jgi:coproporphyrinogen III oxidase-like Fe-S oxidoreductase
VNLRHPADHRAAVARGGPGIAREDALTLAVARGEFVITGLRRIAGVDTEEFARRFATTVEGAFPHVAGLIDDGLVEIAAGRLRLTARGLVFADTVSATFV